MGDLERRRRDSSAVEAANPDVRKAIRMLGLNPDDPKAHALLLVCKRYDLDPFLGHVSIYKDGGLYVHAAAYVHLANQHPAYEGYRVVKQWEDDKQWWAEVEVYHTGWRYPSVGVARSAKNKPKKGGQGTYLDDDADEKAVTKALRRALRRSFNVDWPHPYYEANPAGEPVVPSEAITEVVRRVDTAEAAAEAQGEVEGEPEIVDRNTGELYDYGPDDDDPTAGGLDAHGWPPEDDDDQESLETPAGAAVSPPPAAPAAPSTPGASVPDWVHRERAERAAHGRRGATRTSGASSGPPGDASGSNVATSGSGRAGGRGTSHARLEPGSTSPPGRVGSTGKAGRPGGDGPSLLEDGEAP
jgi:hypothetical protein